MASVLAGITSGAVALKSADERRLQPPVAGAGGGLKAGKPSFRTELKKRMVRKQQSIMQREQRKGMPPSFEGSLETFQEEESEYEEEEYYEEVEITEDDEIAQAAQVKGVPPLPPPQAVAPPPAPPTAVKSTPTAAPSSVPAWKAANKPPTPQQPDNETTPAPTQNDLDKWAGVPAWKRKVLEEKAKRDAAINAPKLEAERREAERQAKLAAMPTWKRNLLAKKGVA